MIAPWEQPEWVQDIDLVIASIESAQRMGHTPSHKNYAIWVGYIHCAIRDIEKREAFLKELK